MANKEFEYIEIVEPIIVEPTRLEEAFSRELKMLKIAKDTQKKGFIKTFNYPSISMNWYIEPKKELIEAYKEAHGDCIDIQVLFDTRLQKNDLDRFMKIYGQYCSFVGAALIQRNVPLGYPDGGYSNGIFPDGAITLEGMIKDKNLELANLRKFPTIVYVAQNHVD